MTSAEDMERALREGDIENVYVEFPDLDGISRSKLVDADYFLDHWEEGFSMNMLLLAVSSMTDVPEDSGYGGEINFADGTVLPVPETFDPLPWRENAARVICEFRFRGEPAGAYTRGVLERVLTDAEAELDVEFGVGHELEFHLLDVDDGRRPATDHEHECVTRATERVADYYDRLKRWCEHLDVPLTSLQHEYGAGQFEVLFDYGPPVRSADRAFTFREVVKEAAAVEGRRATFMAKPFTDASANGYHLHVSAFDGDRNLLAAEDGDGLSEAGRAFVGGLLEHADALTGLLCPTINAFKRFTPGSFSPFTRSWGYNNRTAAVRIPESAPTRIENRIGSADANPYLVLAGTIAAGLDGVRRGLDPGEPVDGDAQGQRPPLVRSQEVALRALESDEVLVEALGEEFVRAFTAVKRRERDLFNDHVTDWEKRYLDVQ